jgi:two-component system, OmpR family, sensor kinase
MRLRSIRARLTFWHAGLLAVTFVILGGAAYGLMSYSLFHEVDNALNGVAKAMAERARGGSTAFVPSDIDELFRHFFGFSPWDRYFEMLDPSGRHDPRQPAPPSHRPPLTREALSNASHGLSTFETVEGGGKYPIRILTMPIMEGGHPASLIQVGMSLQSVMETRARFLVIMAAVLPAGLLLAGLGGWLLVRRALKPVEQMTDAAHRISAEHLARRVEETGEDDELDRLAKTLNQMLGRLDVAFNQVRRFTADASHELQTPLTILKGELEVALRSPRTVEEYQDTIRSCLEEIDRIAHLVEGLLLLARAEGGVVRMDRQTTDLARLTEEVHWRLKALADAHSIDLCTGPLEDVSVPGDAERLKRLLLNLVDNAIKYTGPGGRVTLSVQREGSRGAIRVSDTGRGIEGEDLDRIFQPFFRAPEALPERGVGLGLSIAQSIAHAHGGEIHVQSTPGEGSTFTVLLPVES